MQEINFIVNSVAFGLWFYLIIVVYLQLPVQLVR